MYPLLMTATIDPGNAVKYSIVNDPATRWIHYSEALTFWLTHTTVTDLIFCENSAYPIDYSSVLHLAETHSKHLEIISYSGNANASSHGKGYTEGEIINYALDHSALLKDASGFYKITGRLIVKNFNLLAALYDQRSTIFTKFSGLNDLGVDSRFFKVDLSFYNEVLRNAHQKVNEQANIPIERAYLLEMREVSRPVSSFWPLPDIRGVAASTGIPYPKGFSRRIVRNALALAGLWRVKMN